MLLFARRSCRAVFARQSCNTYRYGHSDFLWDICKYTDFYMYLVNIGNYWFRYNAIFWGGVGSTLNWTKSTIGAI